MAAPGPVFSIVVPFLNQASYLRACLEGIFAQRFSGGYEVIMVNNNSTDSSCAIVGEFPQAALLHEAQQGAYAARNRGVRHARGRFLAFLDGDCVPEPDWLAALYRALTVPGTAIAKGPIRPACEEAPLSWISDYENARDIYVYRSEDPNAYYGSAGNMALSRETFDRFGPFAERLRGGDTAFVQRVVHTLGCDAAIVVPEAVVRHLEVESVAAFFRKMYTYGRSRQGWRSSLTVRTLHMSERFRVYRLAVRSAPRSVFKASVLLMLLSAGLGWWIAGALAGRMGARL